MTDQPTNPAAVEPQVPHADGGNTDFETEAEATDATPEQTNSLSITSGIAGPPSPTLDTEDGGSDWDPDNFVAPALEDMPTEGPGSPGYDVYAPENAQWENPQDDSTEVDSTDGDDAEANAPLPDEVEDEEDTKAALERETADGPGEVPVDQLPESDIPAGTELVDDDDKKDDA